MKVWIGFLGFFSAAVIGCSGSTSGSDLGAAPNGPGKDNGSVAGAHDALFEAPSNETVTPDDLYGVWGGTTKDLSMTFDARMQLSASSVTFATRCILDNGSESSIVGVKVAARVGADEIAVLESKSDEKDTGGVKCRATTRPETTKRCERVAGFQKTCFWLDGRELTLYGNTPFEKLVFTKLSD
jgi:hypothetical protein